MLIIALCHRLRSLKNQIAQIMAPLNLGEFKGNFYWYKALRILLPFSNNTGLLLLVRL